MKLVFFRSAVSSASLLTTVQSAVMIGMSRKKLELRPHDPEWAHDFVAERSKIVGACGANVVRIEHIGSTAVPGMHAKPILDLAIIVNRATLAAVAVGLETIGYSYRGEFEPDEPDHFYAVRDKGLVRFCQAHIYESETADFQLKLAFRDALRRDRVRADEYNDCKLQLAARISDKSEYARIKDEWVSEFILRLL